MKKILFILIFILPTLLFAEEITAPSEPLNLSVEPVLDNGNPSFNLTWSAPLSDGGSTISGYNVFYRQFGAKEWLNYQTVNLSYSITGEILSETKYDFAVSAYNVSQEGPQSEIVQAISLALEIDKTPPVISDLLISDITESTAVVSWTTDELSTSQINFDVHSADQHQNYISKTNRTDHSFNLEGLLPCTTYFYYVTSEDTSANVSNSDIESFTTAGCLGGVTKEGSSNLLSPELIRSFELNGDVEITARDGSFEVESVFQIKKLNIQEVDANVGCPANKKPVGGKVYDIKFLDDYNSETNLSEPAIVKINYEDSEVEGLNEDDISMYHYDENARVWEKLTSCTLDKAQNTITCEVSSFSKFTLMADPEKCQIEKPIKRRLYLGSYGEDVMHLNNFLNESGYETPKDSYSFGLKTLKALRKYHKDNIENLRGKKSFWLENFFTFVGKSTMSYINDTKE